MIYKKGSNEMTAGAIAALNQKSFVLGEYVMKTTVIAAGMISARVILQNLTVFTKQEAVFRSYIMLVLGIVMLGCCIRYAMDEFILLPCAERKRLDTLECQRKIHFLSNDELIKLFIIEGCPQVKEVHFQDKSGVYLRGKYTMHFVEFGQEGAMITSKKKDYRAAAEANAIMRVLVNACN